jgi:hypothetical protein
MFRWSVMSMLAVLLAAESANAAPRVLVCLPKGAASLSPEVERAFAWASPVVLAPDTVAQRFPRSPESQATADGERRVAELLRAAEADFLALRFDAATARLDDGARILDNQPPSVRVEAAFIRLQLLRGRVAEARGGAGAAEAFARAAEAAIEIELDEAEYPPRVREAYVAARAAVRARPRGSVEVTSQPSDAEIEVDGQLAGRTPARVALPPGRCFMSVTRAGFKPHLAACPTESKAAIVLQPANQNGLRDQLRDRITSDAAWFLEPVLLDMLATVEDARWIVVLARDRDRGRGLKALVFSAAEHALKPIEPARFVDAELDKLSAAVRVLVLRGQRLDASAIDTPSGIPAVEARAADPGLGSAVAFVRRAGSRDYLRLGLAAAGGGRFTGGLPPLLADDGGWDVEYYVEGRDASGGVACTAGDAATPLRFRRPAGVAGRAMSGRPSRWYLWLALGVAAAGAAATGVYLGTRSDDVSVRFGARP